MPELLCLVCVSTVSVTESADLSSSSSFFFRGEGGGDITIAVYAFNYDCALWFRVHSLLNYSASLYGRKVDPA